MGGGVYSEAGVAVGGGLIVKLGWLYGGVSK